MKKKLTKEAQKIWDAAAKFAKSGSSLQPPGDGFERGAERRVDRCDPFSSRRAPAKDEDESSERLSVLDLRLLN